MYRLTWNAGNRGGTGPPATPLIVMSNVSNVGPSWERNRTALALRQSEIEERWPFVLFLSNEGPTLELLGFTIRIGRTPTFLYFDL